MSMSSDIFEKMTIYDVINDFADKTTQSKTIKSSTNFMFKVLIKQSNKKYLLFFINTKTFPSILFYFEIPKYYNLHRKKDFDTYFLFVNIYYPKT